MVDELEQAAPFEVRTTVRLPVVVVAVSGELDAAVTAHLQRAVDEALARSPERLVLDVRDLRFLDSHGVACLVAVRKAARTHGAELSVVTGVSDAPALRLLELAGVSALFDLREDIEDAG
jgi:anti-anti-sigma factor